MQAELLDWYRSNRRDLPWRRSKDPYAIWVSECMLQQTQVATVIPYFERWMQRFPTVQSLANAREDEVLSLWQGLGYYRRAKTLLEGAKSLDGRLPTNREEWLAVQGVGAYTAGAIASIALDEPVPIVDGNVERVFARLTACGLPKAKLHRAAWSWAEGNLASEAPGEWNQALMELGATVCTSKNPKCGQCPLSSYCMAFSQGRQNDFPVPAPRKEVIRLKQDVWILQHGGLYGVRQIPSGGWWSGMWEFDRRDCSEQGGLFSDGRAVLLGTFKHTVTHHRIEVTVYHERLAIPDIRLEWRSLEEIRSLPMPAPQLLVLSMLEEYRQAHQGQEEGCRGNEPGELIRTSGPCDGATSQSER